jgi:hypothetical protein
MIPMNVDVYEPFTAQESCEILGIDPIEYKNAIETGTLQCSGFIRHSLPCRLPHHNFWDLLRYCMIAQLESETYSDREVLTNIDESLDELASMADYSQLLEMLQENLGTRYSGSATDEIFERARTELLKTHHFSVLKIAETAFRFLNASLIRLYFLDNRDSENRQEELGVRKSANLSLVPF